MATKAQETLPFMKMHGLGNDFVVLDARQGALPVSSALARALGDRHRGVGFDQLALIEYRGAALHLTFYNADGSLSATCGNATRCIARHLMDESGETELVLFTERGQLSARACSDGRTTVNMGQPQLHWRDIPLAEDLDTLSLPVEGNPVATGMGNPHMTFFVENAEAVDLARFGAAHEHHPLYPQRTNVQVAQVTGPDRLRMRVWERGAGITLASGSSSCAVAVAAARRGLTGPEVTLDLDGGTLNVAWRDDGVWMTGPTMHVFSGELTPEFLESLA
jgi:diaminopimelate epimerase